MMLIAENWIVIIDYDRIPFSRKIYILQYFTFRPYSIGKISINISVRWDSETPQLHNFIQILPMIILSFVVWADPLGRAGTYGTRPSERCAGAYASPLAAPTRGRSGPRAGVRGYPRA